MTPAEPPMEPTRADVRRALFAAIADGNFRTVSALRGATASLLLRWGFRKGVSSGSGFGDDLSGRTEARFRENVWDLIASGVLVPGFNAQNPDWPNISLTEAGQELLLGEDPTPADPDSFVAHIAEHLTADAEDRVLPYVREAVGAFNRQLYLAATVMLGSAAEGLVHGLARAIARSMGPAGEAWLQREIEARQAVGRIRAVAKEVEAVQKDLPRELREGFEAHWGSIQGLIRMERNEAGHPTGARRSRHEVLPLLLLFPTLTKLVRRLEEWFLKRAPAEEPGR